MSEALESPYEELLKSLPDEERLNVDETGHKQNRLGAMPFGRLTRRSLWRS